MAQINGWHVLGGFGLAFGIIIGVNLYMATEAVRTFPGLEVANTYVASQNFDAERSAQEALGWEVEAKLEGQILRLSVSREGAAVEPVIEEALFGRAATDAYDQVPAFAFDGTDFVATVAGGPGTWDLRVKLRAGDGTLYHKRLVVEGQS